MDRSEITPTLLHAILKNQSAIANAIHDLAGYVDRHGDTPVAESVRGHLQTIEDSERIVGLCIKALMK